MHAKHDFITVLQLHHEKSLCAQWIQPKNLFAKLTDPKWNSSNKPLDYLAFRTEKNFYPSIIRAGVYRSGNSLINADFVCSNNMNHCYEKNSFPVTMISFIRNKTRVTGEGKKNVDPVRAKFSVLSNMPINFPKTFDQNRIPYLHKQRIAQCSRRNSFLWHLEVELRRERIRRVQIIF